MQIACFSPLAHVVAPLGEVLLVQPPRQASHQLSQAPMPTLVLSPIHFVEIGLLVQAWREMDHVEGSGIRSQLVQVSGFVSCCLVVHVHGCAWCAPFSMELTRGWGLAEVLLGFFVQVPEVAGWSVQLWLLDIEVHDVQSCHICSTSWEDFHILRLAKRTLFSHVLGAGWSYLAGHIF